MPWVGNQYIFPRAAPAYATWPAPPAPPAPPTPPVIPQRWRRPEQIDGGDGDFEDPPDSSYAVDPFGTFGPFGTFDPEASLRFGEEVDEAHPYETGQRFGGYVGAGLGLLTGTPGFGLGLGLLGAYSDVVDAEKEMEALGYARPDLSVWGAWDPFGLQARGFSPDESPYAQLMAHFMGITDPKALGFTPIGMHEMWGEDLDVPGLGSSVESIQAAIDAAEAQVYAESWGGYETSDPSLGDVGMDPSPTGSEMGGGVGDVGGLGGDDDGMGME